MRAINPYVFPYVNDIPNRVEFGLQSSVLHPDDPGNKANVLVPGIPGSLNILNSKKLRPVSPVERPIG
jgi:hypothetical protein